jgi:predicted esterase
MSLFRITNSQTFTGPHQQQPLVQGGVAPENAKAAIIMIHGRGASAQSIISLSDELDARNKLTLYAPQADGFTWYPFSFLAPKEQNQPGLNSGLQAVFNTLEQAKKDGFSLSKIFLLGFSQGACLASEFVARHPDTYGGLFVLSGGLIGKTIQTEAYSGSLSRTRVFMGCSDIDAHIPVERFNESAELFSTLNAQLTKKIYPNMGHTVNQDEIQHINQIINDSIGY